MKRIFPFFYFLLFFSPVLFASYLFPCIQNHESAFDCFFYCLMVQYFISPIMLILISNTSVLTFFLNLLWNTCFSYVAITVATRK